MDNYERILVVTDGLESSAPTLQSGLSIAKNHNSKVILVDTIHSPGKLAQWFSANANEAFEEILTEKQNRLEKQAETIRTSGLDVEAKVLFGKSSDAIINEVVETNADLVVRYAKGAQSKFAGLVGNTARALMRNCPAPILLASKQVVDQPRVLACLDASHDIRDNNAIVFESSRLSQGKDRLIGLYCWEMYGAEMIKNRLNPDKFKESLNYTERMFQQIFESMLKNVDDALIDKNKILLRNGQASQAIPEFCKEENIDVVTMCTATLNHPLRRYFGSTVDAILENLPCALLAVKPEGFLASRNEKPLSAT